MEDPGWNLIKKLGEAKPNWDKVIPRFRNHKTYYTEHLKGGGNHILSVSLAKISLQCSLEELCAANPNAASDPIVDGEETKNYIFSYIGGQLSTTIKNRRTNDCRLIDALAVVAGNPILFEVRLVTDMSNLNKSISESGIARALGPIKERFQVKDPKFVVISYPHTINYSSPNQSLLISKGGIILPHYCKQAEFLEEIRGVRLRYRL